MVDNIFCIAISYPVCLKNNIIWYCPSPGKIKDSIVIGELVEGITNSDREIKFIFRIKSYYIASFIGCSTIQINCDIISIRFPICGERKISCAAMLNCHFSPWSGYNVRRPTEEGISGFGRLGDCEVRTLNRIGRRIGRIIYAPIKIIIDCIFVNIPKSNQIQIRWNNIFSTSIFFICKFIIPTNEFISIVSRGR